MQTVAQDSPPAVKATSDTWVLFLRPREDASVACAGSASAAELEALGTMIKWRLVTNPDMRIQMFRYPEPVTRDQAADTFTALDDDRKWLLYRQSGRDEVTSLPWNISTKTPPRRRAAL